MDANKKIVGLSPMAGYTDSPFRALVRNFCPEVYLVTELISADGLKYNSVKTKEMLCHFPEEDPLIVQLFGKNPDFFMEASTIAEKMGAKGIDINMGCPARKVIHSGHGSALILKPDLAYEIVAKTVSATKLPVSVKTRLAWNRDNITSSELTKNLINFCQGLEKAGAKMICIHGRTVKQEYTGIADWEPIYCLKDNLNIKVIGNGDIKSVDDAKNKIQNLDGVFIGRGAIGKPWLIKQIYASLNNLPIPPDPNLTELKQIIWHHANLAEQVKGYKGILEMRKNLITYLKGLPNASNYRQKLVSTNNLDEIKQILDEIN